MKNNASIILYFIFVITSCNQIGEQQNYNHLAKEESSSSEKSNQIIENCIGKIDSLNIRQSIGCEYAIYGHISENYVLEIKSTLFSRINFSEFHPSINCLTYKIENKELICDLLIFEDRKANLRNLCTDLIISDNPKPSRRISASKGILVGITDNDQQFAYLKFDELVFIDSLNHNMRIEFENLILWKVKNLGMPG